MLARLSLLGALLSGACAASDPFPISEREPGSLSSKGYWLARADEAESRGDAAAALLCLERWEHDFPERLDHAFHVRRLRLARSSGDQEALLTARSALLAEAPEDEVLRFEFADDLARVGEFSEAAALLEGVGTDPTTRLRALRRTAEYLELAGEFGAAAERMELAARDPGAGAAAPAWWERASWLWERSGDRARATRAIETALDGMELGVREGAALARLRAFELGELASVEDASAVLRFHTDPELRVAAVRFLGARRFPDEISVFGRSLADPEERVVVGALEQLAERFTAAERGYVASCARKLTQDLRPEVRVASATLLGASGVADDVPLLLEALDPEDRAQFRAVRRALQTLSGVTLPAPLDPDLVQRRQLLTDWTVWWKERGAPR